MFPIFLFSNNLTIETAAVYRSNFVEGAEVLIFWTQTTGFAASNFINQTKIW